MNQFRKNKKGETILETVIALTIIAIGITFSSAIIGSSLRNINVARNRIIAINIARQGIEAIRNIRDTNWLKFNSNRRRCWNHDPNIDQCDVLNPTPIDPGDYIVYKQDGTEKWLLGELKQTPSGPTNPATGSLNEIFYNTTDTTTYISTGDEWIDMRTLYLVDVDTITDTDGDRIPFNDADLYNNVYVEAVDSWGREVKKTVFRRSINIEYLDDDGIAGDTLDNRMRITATVVWREGGGSEFKSQLSTHLTDYLGRNRLES